MRRYAEEKIFDRVDDVAWNLADAASDLQGSFEFMVDAADELEAADENLQLVVEAARDSHAEYLALVSQIKNFDRYLAKLMTLRGELAEVTGIPMFSHIGANKRYPSTRDTYDV
jgi:hypothetical protein